MSEFTEHQIEGRQVVRRDGVNVLEVNDNGNLEVHIPKGIRKGDIGDFFEYVHHFAETGRLFDEPERERLPVTFKWRYCCDQPEDTQYGMFSWDGIQWHFVARGGSSSIKEFRNAGCIVEKWLTDPPDDLRALVEGGAE